MFWEEESNLGKFVSCAQRQEGNNHQRSREAHEFHFNTGGRLGFACFAVNQGNQAGSCSGSTHDSYNAKGFNQFNTLFLKVRGGSEKVRKKKVWFTRSV